MPPYILPAPAGRDAIGEEVQLTTDYNWSRSRYLLSTLHWTARTPDTGRSKIYSITFNFKAHTGTENVGSHVQTSHLKSNTLWMALHKGPQNSCTFDIPAATNI